MLPAGISPGLSQPPPGVLPTSGSGGWFRRSPEASNHPGGGPSVSPYPPALFRGGLVFKAHRLVYHSTLGVRVIKKKKKKSRGARPPGHLNPNSRSLNPER